MPPIKFMLVLRFAYLIKFVLALLVVFIYALRFIYLVLSLIVLMSLIVMLCSYLKCVTLNLLLSYCSRLLVYHYKLNIFSLFFPYMLLGYFLLLNVSPSRTPFFRFYPSKLRFPGFLLIYF